MKLYTLRQPVRKTGSTMLGFGKSVLTLSPNQVKPCGFEPLFLKNQCGQQLPLTLGATTLKSRRIEVCGLGLTIKAVEHYTPLRFLFPGIGISGERGELPYFTCTGSLIDTMMSYADPFEIKTSWYTVHGAVGYTYPEKRGGIEAFTMIEPNHEKRLQIHVTVKFPRFGELSRRFVFPDENLLREVLSIGPLGTPSWLEWPAKFLWAHGHAAYWPKSNDTDVLEKITMHRVQDILGVLALVESPIKGSFPSLNIYSQCSGHLGDLKALRMIQTVPLA